MKGWSKAMIDGGGGWGCEQGKAGLAAGLGGACSHASSPWKDRAGLRHQQKEIPGCCQLLSSQDNHASCFSLAQEQKSGGGGGGRGLYAKRGANSRLQPRPGAKPASQEPGYRGSKGARTGE